jgi:hypothetical protein
MTAEKLYALLKFIEQLDNSLKLQKNLELIANALTNLASSPAAPQYQASLADALAASPRVRSNWRS